MKTLTLAALIGFAAFGTQALAIIPGNPRTIAGVYHIKPHEVGVVLREFCKTNGCTAKLETEFLKYGYGWNIYIRNGKWVAGAGEDCALIPHRYCVQAEGPLGDAFMTKTRVTELKWLLEAKGAKVTLMNCKLRPGDALCANGKPPP